MISVGRFDIFSVVNGTFALDGGAMFGVVPKVLWQKKITPDAHNRIPLAMRTLVAVDRSARHVLLADTGAGSKWDPQEAARYAIQDRPTALAAALHPLGLTESDVTDVIVTHLHFDHAGGMTRWKDKPEGEAVARFPNARHWIHESHLHHAQNPTLRDQASFFTQDFELLQEKGLFRLISGDAPEPSIEGVNWFVSNGHSPYQLLPLFEDAAAPLLFVGDIFPTHHHLLPAWVMAYDLYPLTTVEEKERILRMCLERNLQLAFPHDADHGGVAVEMRAGKPIISRSLDL